MSGVAKVYDIAIVGGTPGGYAAAYWLARAGCDVLVMDWPDDSAECMLSDWVGKGFFKLPGLPASLAKACGAAAFKRVCYHDTTCRRRAEYRPRSVSGHFIAAGNLVKAMRAAASDAGAEVRSTRSPCDIELGEDCVRLIGARRFRARLLIMAKGSPCDVVAALSISGHTAPASPLVVAALDVPLSGRGKLAGSDAALHVVESSRRRSLGIFFVVGGVAHVRVICASWAEGIHTAELSSMVERLGEAGILPPGAAIGRSRGAVWRPPAGVALDMEIHAAKRCLLIGTAGGFAESVTGQTSHVSVRSALLASKTAIAALKSKHMQETLMGFKSSWRRSLADYLRSPNTSLHMLLPLLFVNDEIVSRFTRALLYGENI